VVDYTDGELIPGDVFVMATDGVWEVLGERVVREVLDAGGEVQTIADELVRRSVRNQVQYMGRNDATVVVVAVEKSERQG
jgi:protein phosphatase